MVSSSESEDLVERRQRDIDPKPSISGNNLLLEPFEWIRMLSRELNASFVLGVALVYGLNQGFTGSIFRVVTDYYWKDVQKVQPSAVQMYVGFYYIPWIMKPVWGVLTDLFPVFGYRRRPYFILAGAQVKEIASPLTNASVEAFHKHTIYGVGSRRRIGELWNQLQELKRQEGQKELDEGTQEAILHSGAQEPLTLGILGTSAALIVSMHGKLPIVMALLCLVGMAGAIAIADVTIDACIARNSIEHPLLAADMQSLCGFVSAVGALIGYLCSGVFVHHLGAQGALGILALPPLLLVILGFVIFESRTNHHSQKTKKVMEKVGGAVRGMGRTIQCPQVWKPSLYMFLSLALSISTHEGHFYWYTDPKAGPAFSQEFIGIIYAIGAMASLVGVLMYHKLLKDYPFRSLLFYAQLLYGVSGMLDLVFVLRWNLKLKIPDYAFVVLEECCSRIISKIRWMPMIVLSTKLCPLGIEGTFFALLMCIDSLGSLASKTGGGVILHLFHVTRTDFENLWLVVLMRNLMRFSTLGLIFLVPKADQLDILLPQVLRSHGDEEDLQLMAMNGKEDEMELM